MVRKGIIMKKIIPIILLLVLVSIMFSGCRNNTAKSQPISVAIGVANTLNNSQINVSGVLESTIDNILSANGSTLSVFEIDGECYKVDSVKSEYEFGQSQTNRKSKKKTYIYQAKNYIKNAVPKTAEIDILYALNALINDVTSQAYGTDNKKSIIIISNLLSTKGLIDFVKNTMYFEPNTYAEFLQSEIPNMNNIDVIWIVTQATDDQEMLQQSDKDNLKSFYKALIENAGGSVEFIDENVSKTDIDHSSWPSVSAVDVRKKEFANSNNIDITLDESTLFKSDSTEWVDEQSAEKKLKSFINAINNSQYKTLIAGSTATTNASEENHVELSKKRADKVKDKLISLGVSPNKLISIGIGKSYTQYRVPDTGAFESEDNKAKNRCVFIISENTDKAQYFESVAERFAINHL